MAFVNLNPGTLLAPVPAVLVSCAREGEKPNAVTIAWAGTVNSDPPMVSISVRPERYSHDIIEETGEFVVMKKCIRISFPAACSKELQLPEHWLIARHLF